MLHEPSYRREIARAVISAPQPNTSALEQLTDALVEHEAYSHQIIDGTCLWRRHQETCERARRAHRNLSLDYLVSVLLLAFDLEDLWKIDAADQGNFRRLPYSSGFVGLDGTRYTTAELLAHPNPESVLNREAYALFERLRQAARFATLAKPGERLTQIMAHIIVHGDFDP